MCNAVFTLTINLDKHTYIINIANIAKKLNMQRYLRNETSVFQFCKLKKKHELYYNCIVFLYTIKNDASAEGNIYIHIQNYSILTIENTSQPKNKFLYTYIKPISTLYIPLYIYTFLKGKTKYMNLLEINKKLNHILTSKILRQYRCFKQ